MNGSRYIFDTNAIVALLKGNSSLLNLAENAEWIGISIISYMEFHSFQNLSQEDYILFNSFSERVEIVDLSRSDNNLIETIIKLRKSYSIKLPDSIIASTAYCNNAKLITADKDFYKIKDITIISF